MFSIKVHLSYSHLCVWVNSNIDFIAYDPLSKQKAPKVLADSIVWINQALTEFGIGGLSLRNLIEFLKTALKNSNAAVRSNATTALVTVRLFAGSSKFTDKLSK